MRILFYFGWALLIFAFLITATDPYLAMLGAGGLWTPTYDVWYAYAPGSLVLTEIRIEKVMPALWDPVIVTILQVPGWLLFGIPGTALVWIFRPNKVMSPEMREEYERHKESLFVIDELSREARMDEHYDHGEDDQAPSHQMFDLHMDEDEDIRASVTKGDIPAGYPAPEYLENWDAELDQTDIDDMDGMNKLPAAGDMDISTLPPPGSVLVDMDTDVTEDTAEPGQPVSPVTEQDDTKKT